MRRCSRYGYRYAADANTGSSRFPRRKKFLLRGLPTHRLEIELTEAALVRDLDGAQVALAGLREAGVRIVLDDFGTGYSSLYHLRNFKIDKIKIDRSFIEDMEREPEAATLVRALLGLGQGLGLTVTAEGVQNPAQATALRELGATWDRATSTDAP
jgi:EAL domain-containing protein (putative c-di-GMP-specific phosphodiesterase class I)